MPNVAVVGAGPQGLVALKNLLAENFEATVFEKRQDIGGVWQYTEDPSATSILPTTIANTSKWNNCFTDFPAPEDAPPHMGGPETADFIRAYASHFGLQKHIQFGTQVQHVVRTSDKRRWRLSLRRDGTEEIREFDKVLFCNGRTHTAFLPKVEGADTFQGKIIHCQAFKRPEAFAGQRVVVVGFGCSAADTACALVGHADEIYISHRHGIKLLARWVDGKPLGVISMRRFFAFWGILERIAPQLSQKLFDFIVGKVADSCFKVEPAWGFKPAQSVITNGAMISDEIVDHLRSGSIISLPGILRFTGGHHIVFEDGTERDADAVIFCTGYHPDYPLMPQFSAPSAEAKPLARLYQNIFHPSYPDSVAYLCNWQLGVGILSYSDLASMAIIEAWKGTFSLPPREQMESEIDAHHAWARTAAGKHGAVAETINQVPWTRFLHDAAGTGINENLGYGWRGWLYWLRQPAFCNMLMGGVDSPHIMRLFHGRRKSWPGARDAIIRANKEVQMCIKAREESRLREAASSPKQA